MLYNSSDAPSATVVPPAVVPSAELLVALKTPAEIVVVPEYSLDPDRTKVPALDFVKPDEVKLPQVVDWLFKRFELTVNVPPLATSKVVPLPLYPSSISLLLIVDVPVEVTVPFNW